MYLSDTTLYKQYIQSYDHQVILASCTCSTQGFLQSTSPDFFTLRFLLTGNISISPFSRHCRRCVRIFDCSKLNSSGFSPKARAVAKAIANSPQSYEPDCIATSINSILLSCCHYSSNLGLWLSPSTGIEAVVDMYSWVGCLNGGNCNPVPLSRVHNLDELAWLDIIRHCQATAD